MTNRVYGVNAIKSIMGNWNADFTKRPKTTANGDIYGSDKALKFSIRKYWRDSGLPVLFIKTYKITTKTVELEETDKNNNKKKSKVKVEKLQPKDISERYNELFSSELSKATPSKEVLKNLFSTIDVMNFGATFTASGQNISITGAVQIGQGYNKYDKSRIEEQAILSPFRNPNEKSEDKDASSIGSMIMSDEAHYFYPFVINPENYNPYKNLDIDNFEGYTEESYNHFKEASLLGATSLNTNSKTGCENEFALFIECKDNTLILPDLTQFIKFEKVEKQKYKINLSGIDSLLKGKEDKIKKIEIYYNNYNIDLITNLNANKYNIFTREEI